MDNYTIVRPEFLNHHGSLFGGQMLKWVDEFAWLTAARDFPHCRLVTIAMDDIVFRHPAPSGSILRFHIAPANQGTTSITYSVEVFADEPGADVEKSIFSTTVTFVRIDETGNKTPLPKRDSYRSMS
ncbi:MAG: acyl-CoA thioesterase [Phycisphaerae bacterium]